MRSIIVVISILCYIMFRNTKQPLELLYPGKNITNSFYNCTDGINYFDAPTSLSLQSTGNIRLEIRNPNNRIIRKYYIEPMIKYWFNMTNLYKGIDDSCQVILFNSDKNHVATIKQHFYYLPFWKYLVYLAEKHLDNDMILS